VAPSYVVCCQFLCRELHPIKQHSCSFLLLLQVGTTGPALVQQVAKEAVKKLASLQELRTIRDEDMPCTTVGLESRMDVITELLGAASGKSGMMLLHGMGGVGKTTLAQAVFNQLHAKDRTVPCCFLRLDPVSQPRDGRELAQAQLELLKQLALLDDDVKVVNTSHGRQLLHTFLRDKKVLVVVDNVWDGQLEQLLPGDILKVLAEGSVVLVTSRDSRGLGPAGLFGGGRCLEQEVQCLSEEHALQLLCLHAYGPGSPPADEEDLVRMVAELCEGLPMAVEAAGRHLQKVDNRHRFFSHMESALDFVYSEERVSRLDYQRTVFEELGISWDALQDEEKEALLDIMCLLKGLPWELVEIYCKDGVLERLRQLAFVRHKVEDDSNMRCVTVHSVVAAFCAKAADARMAYRREMPSDTADGRDIADVLSLVRPGGAPAAALCVASHNRCWQAARER
jgi:hypothetical protein